MAELTNHTETNLFTTSSNEHTLFAGTLRNWGDPLLQGQEPIPVPICPRCATCRCESLKALPKSSASQRYHHHHQKYHEPSCPNFRQHERARTTSKQRQVNKPKRRVNSYDPSITLDNHKSLKKQSMEYSSSASSTPLIKQRHSFSKIPVRISTSSSTLTTTTTASEYSPASSVYESRSLNLKTKIPRPIVKLNSSYPTLFTHTNQTISSSDDDDDFDDDDDDDHDSLNGDVHPTPPSMSTNELSHTNMLPKKKKKNIIMMYCTSNHIDDIDDQVLIKKKKKKMLSSPRIHSFSESSSDEQHEQRFWYKEG
ncbi:unnamed protein product [Adineta steineri]|uniref:Uncharacterized protein n=1 Tax=Adineta steineri TaxID=433720 RepID=A0A815DV64_9BILA|nr:unnamed protein product [Adineta steineri]CAF3777677.1 unnamed protein product [Adineta steineri]